MTIASGLRSIPVLAAAAVLLGCTPAERETPMEIAAEMPVPAEPLSQAAETPAEEPPAAALRASGNEPPWLLTLVGDELTLLLDYGSTELRAVAVASDDADGEVRHWQARSGDSVIDMALRPGICEDTMTGMPHPYTARVMLDGRELRGCGGDPRTLLTGATWVVEDLAGGGIVDGSRATLTFESDGRVYGEGSCNSYRGGYSLTGEGLSFGDLASTLMACVPALMDQETKFHGLLRQVYRFGIDDTGALILHTPTSGTILARQDQSRSR